MANTQEKAPAANPAENAELEALKAELEKAKAELAEAQKPGETAPANAAPQNDPKRRVTIMLFKDNGKYKDPLYVSVNGYNAQIQRGVPVEVPYYVKKHIEEMQTQDVNTALLIENHVKEYEDKAKQLN